MTQVWLITGSSRGFGRQLAEAVLTADHKLLGAALPLGRRYAPFWADWERFADRSRQRAVQGFELRPGPCSNLHRGS
jgi:NAD(P)-dependent dehydrogenase (short-subunit alcohol dehydrogenase family)